MKGQWLEAAGFATGTKVEVRVMAGCIVLTAAEPVPELEEAMRRVEAVGEEAEAGPGVYRGNCGESGTEIINIAPDVSGAVIFQVQAWGK